MKKITKILSWLILLLLLATRPVFAKGHISDGLYWLYDDCKNLKALESYKTLKRDGFSIVYFENGNMKEQFGYQNGILEGTAREYFEDGKLFLKRQFKNGQLQGSSQRYHKNGKLWVDLKFKDNQLEGLALIFTNRGFLDKVITYQKGKIVNIKDIDQEGHIIYEKKFD